MTKLLITALSFLMMTSFSFGAVESSRVGPKSDTTNPIGPGSTTAEDNNPQSSTTSTSDTTFDTGRSSTTKDKLKQDRRAKTDQRSDTQMVPSDTTSPHENPAPSPRGAY